VINLKEKLSRFDEHWAPKGVEHKPVAENECHVLLMEPRGVINTGEAANADAAGALTAPQDQWV
jgi:hypothetical protein